MVKKFIPFGSISEEFAEKSITMTAPTKSFNLAGLCFSNIIIKNKRMRDNYKASALRSGHFMLNMMSYVAAKAAFEHCEGWLEELIVYVKENYRLLKSELEEKLPGVYVFPLEATYLAWIDFRKLGKSETEIHTLLTNGHVRMSVGSSFGIDATGFERMCIAIPRSLLRLSIYRIIKALSPLIEE